MSAGEYKQVQGSANEPGGYEHSRGSSRGYVPLVPHPPPPPTIFIVIFTLLFRYFYIFHVHVLMYLQYFNAK